MLEKQLLLQIGTFILAASPLSIIIIKQIQKTFIRVHSKISNTSIICTNIIESLTEKELDVKSLHFNNFVATVKQKTHLLHIEDQTSKESISVEKIYLKNDPTIQMAAITSQLCHYPHYKKIERIENIINIFFRKCGFNKQKIENEYEILQKIPSDYQKKLSSVVVRNTETREIFAFSKGNPYKILDQCSKVFINGKKVEIDYNLKAKLKNRIKKIEKQGQKTIAYAFRALPLKKLDNYGENFTENELVFLGTIGMRNPLNRNLKPYIEKLKEIGVKTYIVTSMKAKKTTAIGIELGIIKPDYFEIIDSEDLKDLENEQIIKMLSNREKDFAFAELKKEDIKRIRNLLKKVDSKTVFINPESTFSFPEIYKGIEKNRNFKVNYKKIIHHSLPSKIAQLALLFTSLALGMPLSLTIFLILIIELGINLPLELALKSDKPNKKLMSKEFSEKKIRVSVSKTISNGLALALISVGLYLFTLMKFGWSFGNPMPENQNVFIESTTISFLIIALGQILFAYTLRTEKKSLLKSLPQTNPYLLAVTVICLLIIYSLTGIEQLQDFFRLTKISGMDFKIIIFSLLVLFVFTEIKKYILRRLNGNKTT